MHKRLKCLGVVNLAGCRVSPRFLADRPWDTRSRVSHPFPWRRVEQLWGSCRRRWTGWPCTPPGWGSPQPLWRRGGRRPPPCTFHGGRWGGRSVKEGTKLVILHVNVISRLMIWIELSLKVVFLFMYLGICITFSNLTVCGGKGQGVFQTRNSLKDPR